jgi:hypothetical protein
MSLSDLQVFSEFAYSGMTELQAQQVALFNAATRNALVLRAAPVVGDFSDLVYWAKIQNLVRRRNAYGSGTVAAQSLTQLDETAVKVAAGITPINIDPSMLKWIQRSPEEAGVIVGKQMAMDTMADQLNTALLAATVALGQETEVCYDHRAVTNLGTGSVPPVGTLTLAALVTGAAKFGDRSQALVCWIGHSKVIFDIYGAAMVNANRLFEFGTVKVVEDGFGRSLVMTDSPNLTSLDGGTANYATLGLVSGAVDVSQNNDFQDNTLAVNGNENIQRTYQAEWSYNLRIMGFQWDKTNGGKSPNNASIGSSANWDRIATSKKDLAGVLILSL